LANSFDSRAPGIVTRAEFDALRSRVERDLQESGVSQESLTQELFQLQQFITMAQFNQIHNTYSAHDAQFLQARITADKRKEALLIERQSILANPDMDAYYRAIQTHFSSLMVAALGVGSGYISVSQSMESKVADWIGQAISSAFPPAALPMSCFCMGAKYLDKHYREAFLAKIRVFGTTIKEAEELGEEVARLLVRSNFHAKLPISIQKADHDAKALIMAIVKAEPPIPRNQQTAEQLVRTILGDVNYCPDPLPSVAADPAKNCQPTFSSRFLNWPYSCNIE